MAEEVTLKLTVDAVGAAQSVKELKQVIRDATNEALKFKEGSAEFAKFANIAAQAKDKLGDVRQQMAALDPDAKAQSFLRLGNSIVGGFTAGLGAVNLFTGGSEEAQKALLKVQSAMALLQGFQAIEQGVQAFTALRGAIMLAIAGMNAMKLAIIGTGIGAFVVAMGFLIAKLSEATEEFKATTKEMTEHEVELSKLKIEYDNLTGRITNLQKELALLTIQYDKTVNEIAISSQKKLEEATGFWSRLSAGVTDFIYRRQVGSTQAYNIDKIEEQRDKDTLKAKEKFEQEKLNIEQEFANKKIEEDKKNAEKSRENSGGEMAYIKEQSEIGLLELTKIEQKYLDISLKAQKKYVSDKGTIIKLSQNEQLKMILGDASARMQIEQSIFSAIASIGNSTIKNQEKQVAFNKKIAAVQIIVSQAEALAKAVASGAGQVFPANLVAIAAGVAAVAGIFAGISSLFSKAGSIGGAPSLDTGTNFSGVGASISSNTQSPSGVNFLDQPSTNLGTGGNTPPPPPIVIQNVISEYDITKTQSSVNAIQTQATIR